MNTRAFGGGTAFASALGAMCSVLVPVVAFGQSDLPLVDSPPEIYFADEALDAYEKGRCANDQTVVYFSNGVNTTAADALAVRQRLHSRLRDHLNRQNQVQAFGPYVTATAFTKTRGGLLGNFLSDTVFRVGPDDALFYEAQRRRMAAGVDGLPSGKSREEMAEAIALEIELLDTSFSAGRHAAAYDALLDKGRGNVVLGHSYGTILANASYYGVEEYNRPGHALVQAALMSLTVSGADRFAPYPLPFTTIREDWVAKAFPRNKFWNIDNFDNVLFQRGETFLGHNIVDDYLKVDAPGPGGGGQNAHDKIMSDIVAMRLRIEPRPCHGHILGGAATTTDDKTGGVADRQLSNNVVGRYVLHPSPQASVARPSPDGPTKLVDWRGQFVGGEATEVLALSGPAARYNGPAAYGNAVYRWGQIAYRAPESVLGAAIQRDATTDREWIVVVTHDVVPKRDNSTVGDTATVWRRDARLLDKSSAVFDAQTNPKGWKPLTRIAFPAGLQSGPWFFNGDGTEASSIRIVDDTHNFSEREEDLACYQNSGSLPIGYCTPGPDGLGAAYTIGPRAVKEARLYTLSVPPAGSSGQVTVNREKDTVDAALMAVDYDDDVRLVLREENIATDRGYLVDPDPASVDDFRWLTVNGAPLTDAATLKCSVGSAPCRRSKSAGLTRTLGGFVGFMGDLAKEPKERIAYHVFYTDLRTRTYAFSRREQDRTEYWLAHDGDAPELLGAEAGLAAVPYFGYTGSRYGYEGDYRNLSTDSVANRLVDRKGNIERFGKWEKVNPILGRYELRPYLSFFSVSPAPTFGIDVAVDGSVLASGRLPGGATFNYHSKADLAGLLGISLVGETLLPIGVR